MPSILRLPADGSFSGGLIGRLLFFSKNTAQQTYRISFHRPYPAADMGTEDCVPVHISRRRPSATRSPQD